MEKSIGLVLHRCVSLLIWTTNNSNRTNKKFNYLFTSCHKRNFAYDNKIHHVKIYLNSWNSYYSWFSCSSRIILWQKELGYLLQGDRMNRLFVNLGHRRIFLVRANKEDRGNGAPAPRQLWCSLFPLLPPVQKNNKFSLWYCEVFVAMLFKLICKLPFRDISLVVISGGTPSKLISCWYYGILFNSSMQFMQLQGGPCHTRVRALCFLPRQTVLEKIGFPLPLPRYASRIIATLRTK